MRGKKPPRDEHGLYRKECTELAARLGFTEREVWGAWDEVALMIEYEMCAPRAYAEEFALQCVLAMFYKCESGAN